ncbi:MAG: hypothetical protein R3B81_01780 [bacterium]
MSVDPSLDVLLATTARVLEEAAFIFSEPASPASPPTGSVVEATMTFAVTDQPGHHGSLMLSASPGFGTALAANLLGVEPDDPDVTARGAEALCELLNIVAGCLMEEWFPDAPGCRLGIPSARTVAATEHEARRAGAPVSGSLLSEDAERIDCAAFLEG